ncbi:MAG: inosine/xanthosine triphosphatase [Anaerolineales bacterium]|nr:inosine/xanthosine triphosphatase [Anaerolineales bacterium]
MKTVIVASKNPVKIQAVRSGFERMFPRETFDFQGFITPSGVSDQPRSDAEALQGAFNRAQMAAQGAPQAQFWVGVEGGIQEQEDGMIAFAWVVVIANGMTGKARTGAFYLPPRVARLVREGKELGDADDIVFGRSNSKQENGAVGLLTGNVIDRAELYATAVVLALAPFKNPGLYSTSNA